MLKYGLELGGNVLPVRRNIVLVNPKIGTEMDTQRTAPFIPYALLSIATYLGAKYNITILDQRIEKDFYRKLKKWLDHGVVLVGLTCFAGAMIRYAQEILGYNINYL